MEKKTSTTKKATEKPYKLTAHVLPFDSFVRLIRLYAALYITKKKTFFFGEQIVPILRC